MNKEVIDKIEKIEKLIEESKAFDNVPCNGIKEKKGFSCAKDKDGKFFIHTHRARSKSYDSLEKVPQKDIDFIDSTGYLNFRNKHAPDESEQQYVYHYSDKKFPEVKNREMLRLPAPSQASNPEEYNQMVSLLPKPLSLDTIRKYRSSGFKSWGSGPLYEYKISVPKNAYAFGHEIRLTSVPEQIAYARRFPFDKAFSDKGLDRQKALKDDKYWAEIKEDYLKIKRKYREERDKYIRHMISPVLTPQNYATHPYITKIRDDFERWVDFNYVKGDKEQYASYIPHLHTKINRPLIPESVTRII